MPGIIESVFSDPFKILTLVGGSGGVMYWIDRYRNKPRLVVHSISESTGHGRWRVVFEVENIGRQETSLAPYVTLSAFDIGGDKITAKLIWTPAVNRRLAPHAVSEVTAVLDDHLTGITRTNGSAEADLSFSAFRRYTLKLTRGARKTVRIEKLNSPPARNAIGFWFKAFRSSRERRRLFNQALQEARTLGTTASESLPSSTEGGTDGTRSPATPNLPK